MNAQMDQACYNIISSSRRVRKEELDKAMKDAKSSNVPFSDLVIQSGLLKEGDLLGILSKSLAIPFVNLKTTDVDRSIFEKVPIKFAEHYRFFPLKLSGKSLTIAVSRLLDVNTLDEMRLGLGFEVQLSLALEKDIEEMLKKHYGLGATTVSQILDKAPTKGVTRDGVATGTEVEDIEKLAETASVGQLVNQIILDAFKKRASDIHVEPYRGEMRVRYRIDGALQESVVSPEMKRFLMPILSRIKIMANLNIVEKRLPQDGKARVKTQEQELDLRVSSIPTPHGESMVIRILPGKMIFNLDKLGFEKDQMKIFQEQIHKPHGIIFVTGPTGSGKSTTLYAGLSNLNTTNSKIITIEDPVEYELEGVTQIQVVPDIGLSFARGLRSMLRHDPDVMMVGEVRDLETADIAIRVALTGHLVLSTLHTNDAASGVTRLLEMGVEPFLVSSSVNMFVAQRLVRQICEPCRVEDAQIGEGLRQTMRQELGLECDKPIKVFVGKGCDECNGTGFRGRTAIHELLVVNDEIRRMLFLKASAADIKMKARQFGMRTLRQDGWHKVMSGLATVGEILEVTPDDEPLLGLEPHSAEVVHMPVPHEVDAERQAETSDELTHFHERRKYRRVKANMDVRYRVIDISDVPESVKAKLKVGSTVKDAIPADLKNWLAVTECVDISASGIGLEVTQGGVLPGMTIEIRIEPKDGNKPIECVGRVVRVEGALDLHGEGHTRVFKVGAIFLAINSDDRTRLEKFCEGAA